MMRAVNGFRATAVTAVVALVTGLLSAPSSGAVPAPEPALAAAGSNPVGRVDAVTVQGLTVAVRGWAGDVDATTDQRVHFYVDGTANKAVSATAVRNDVVKSYPNLSPRSGFSTTVNMSAGRHTLCVYAINQGGGANTTLMCREFTFGAVGHDPIGRFEFSSNDNDGGMTVRGWAVDQDQPTTPQRLRVTVNGRAGSTFGAQPFTTSVARPDVARAYPWAGKNTGFENNVPWPGRGTSEICVFVVNSGAAPDVRLGCRWVETYVSLEVRGHIDRIAVDPQDPSLRVITGWALNPYDAISPTYFQVTRAGEWDWNSSDGRTACSQIPYDVFYCDSYYENNTFAAGLPRADVDRMFPANGKNHGFRMRIDPSGLDWVAGDRVCLAVAAWTSRGSFPGSADERYCAVYPG